MSIIDKIGKLEKFLEDKKCVLAYSGGSDSTVLAYILSKVSPESLLVTIDNNLMPRGFIDYTISSASEFNLEHKIIKLNFLEDSEFIENNPSRCYNCRKLMYSNIRQLPEFGDYDYFLEGTNITDLLEDRPGNLIRDMYHMTSPLVECQITKQDVFSMIEYLNLDYYDNTTCLATRVKTNEPISKEKLEKIDDIENYIREFVDQRNIRVRTDKDVATIVLDDPMELVDKDTLIQVRKYISNLGFNKVYLDLTSYSKNEFIISEDDDSNYYILPYSINLEDTITKIDDKLGYKPVSRDKDVITYPDVTIHENGRISIIKGSDFNRKFFEILPCVVRVL